MSNKECPSCAVLIEKKATVCPVCGYEIPQHKSRVKWVALLMIILFAWPIIQALLALLRRIW